MPDIIALKDCATLDELAAALNAIEKTNHEVLGLSPIELGNDRINRAVTQTSMEASDLPRLFVKEVPAGARQSDMDAAATAQAKAQVREAFLTFATKLLMENDVLCYAEVAIGTEVKEILLLRQMPQGAQPDLPRAPAKEQPEAVNLTAPSPEDSSAKFKKFMPFIFQWEGETYENDPDDPGGETKFGIDKRSHPNVDIKNLTKEVATAIYWEEWKADGCPGMRSPYAEIFFNCAVNMGLGRARQFGAASSEDAATFLGLQEAYYQKLAQQPRFKKYLKGWLNRTTALRNRFDIPRS